MVDYLRDWQDRVSGHICLFLASGEEMGFITCLEREGYLVKAKTVSTLVEEVCNLLCPCLGEQGQSFSCGEFLPVLLRRGLS